MHPWPYQLTRRRSACRQAARVRREPCLGMVRLIFMIMTVQALGMTVTTPRRSAITPEADGDPSAWIGKRRRTLPVHRSILAVDIEGSTLRKNAVKEELREHVYRLLLEALCIAGIDEGHCDPFTDRGDGVLVLLHPADELPKPLLLTRLMPALRGLLEEHNNGISRLSSHASCGCGRSCTQERFTGMARAPSARTWTSPSGCWTHRGSRSISAR